MRLTRRRFLTLSSVAMAASASLPRRGWSATTLEADGLRLDTLSDGALELPGSFLAAGLSQAEAAALAAAPGLPQAETVRAPCNVSLLRTGDRTVLFDVGAGPDFMASAGRLPEALEAIGLAPRQITDVVFTHGHPDHLWGLLDDFDEPVFAEARHWMGGAEFDYWTDPATAETIGEARLAFLAGAQRRLDVAGDLFERFEPGDEILPGIVARLTPGHTPGHMAFDLGPALLVGDAIGNPHVAFSAPDLHVGSDQNPALAAETRARLMADLAGSGQALVGFHLPQGGVGTVRAEGAGYRFAPA